MNINNRQLLREKLKRQRANLTLTEQKIASANITEQLSHHPLYQKSHAIAGYMAAHYEIDPAALIKKAWQDHKFCYLPIVQEKTLKFCSYQEDTCLKKNRFDILEPDFSPNMVIAAPDLDLVLVPLVGFTSKGQRLGRGAGLYDRSFSFLLKQPRPSHPFLLGLAYEWQKFESFEENSWDVPLDAVVTEKKIYFF